MREVINISLPPAMVKEVRKAVKNGKYASTSEFFRELVRTWLAGEMVMQDIFQAEKEYKAGKFAKINSPRDLMKKK